LHTSALNSPDKELQLPSHLSPRISARRLVCNWMYFQWFTETP
jgi:hypothetical protein